MEAAAPHEDDMVEQGDVSIEDSIMQAENV